MLTVDQPPVFLAMLPDISEKGLFPLLPQAAAPSCLHQAPRLHRHPRSAEQGPAGHWPSKVRVHPHFSPPFASAPKGIFTSLTGSVPPLLPFHTYSSLLLLRRLDSIQHCAWCRKRHWTFFSPNNYYSIGINFFLWCCQNLQLNTTGSFIRNKTDSSSGF